MSAELRYPIKGTIYEIFKIGLASIFVILVLHQWDLMKARKAASSIAAAQRQPAITGDHIGLAGVDFSQHPISMILLTSPTCPYCKASLQFHKRLLAESQKNNTPMYVVLPSKSDATKYNQMLNVYRSQLRDWKDLSLGLNATPTLLAVDNSGIIRATWIGFLKPKIEEEVLRVVSSHALPILAKGARDGVPNFTEAELSALQGREGAIVLDVHERNYPLSHSGIVSIPLPELPFRAAYELDRKKTQVVDCTALEQKICESAVTTLTKAGFQAATVHLGIYENYCSATHVTGL